MARKCNLIVDVDFKENNRSPLKDYLEDVKSKYMIIRATLQMLPSGELKEEMILDLSDSLMASIDKIATYCDKRHRY